MGAIANGDTMSFFGGVMDKVQDAVEDLTDGDGLSADTKEDLHQFFEDVGADKIIDGIKEALKVAIQKAVAITGQMNGFLANELIKIQLPGKLQVVAEALKAAGMDEHVDEFIVSLNRAAEQSAPLAADVFARSISDMTVDDAERIWRGEDTKAATKYLETSCTEGLTTAFTPVVTEAMATHAATKHYAVLEEKALKGLFTVMAEEEEKIRKDPGARVSEL